ncbi:DUF2513 domain-containing protein [Methylocystis sp. Sn-Cys]|uniref:DUF2513 domain-containing protein n=1 Tax=Methylocystis sp. Sn-Cys TaxID=1701263 RepID=UPI001923424D|nr:DUF2513 domain-containing protein [Methylocystis sp. Sn-Cys]MBL1257649.1 DUF2513 domain-containing protein [Methylocystis sp. Sn-Cys]
MARDVDLMRLLLLDLEGRQLSPPEAFVLPLEEIARRLDRTRGEVVDALEMLREAEFIDAPGAFRDDAWIFRKLTRRGVELANLVADARQWDKVKNAYVDLLEG